MGRQCLAALASAVTASGADDGAKERPGPEGAGANRAHALGLDAMHSAATEERKGCGTRAGGRPTPARPERRTILLTVCAGQPRCGQG